MLAAFLYLETEKPLLYPRTSVLAGCKGPGALIPFSAKQEEKIDETIAEGQASFLAPSKKERGISSWHGAIHGLF